MNSNQHSKYCSCRTCFLEREERKEPVRQNKELRQEIELLKKENELLSARLKKLELMQSKLYPKNVI